MPQVIRALAAGACLVASAGPLSAQHPFAVGETLRYEASLGIVPAGTATLNVSGTTVHRGERLYTLAMQGGGGRGALSAAVAMKSWAGGDRFVSYRFGRSTDFRGRSTSDRFTIEPDSGLYRQDGADGAWVTPPRPLDELAMLYYLRTLPLRAGSTHILDGYFRNGYNPVRVRVTGREMVELGSGEVVPCLAITVSAAGLTSEVWLTEDAARLPARLRVPTPVGRVTLVLAGRP
ncbi:MAG TPA: DUF3108 domain-containing protein [Gemmatimonadales bacterium]